MSTDAVCFSTSFESKKSETIQLITNNNFQHNPIQDMKYLSQVSKNLNDNCLNNANAKQNPLNEDDTLLNKKKYFKSINSKDSPFISDNSVSSFQVFSKKLDLEKNKNSNFPDKILPNS